MCVCRNTEFLLFGCVVPVGFGVVGIGGLNSS